MSITTHEIRAFRDTATGETLARCDRALAGDQDAWHLIKAAMAERDIALSHGFDAGNYASAYQTTDGAAALEALAIPAEHAAHAAAYRAAFMLGFYSSHEIDEMGEQADAYLEALRGPHGQRCAAIGIAVPTEDDFDDHNFGEAAW